MRHRRTSHSIPAETREMALCRRARTWRRRGEHRRALLALREAAHFCEDDARLWALYGAQCARMGRLGEAREALVHAAWLRERRQEHEKARTTRAFVARLDASATLA